jgi:hypothetical protein
MLKAQQAAFQVVPIEVAQLQPLSHGPAVLANDHARVFGAGFKVHRPELGEALHDLDAHEVTDLRRLIFAQAG